MARNDATTTLNAPTVPGGEKMDESVVTQSDGATAAKRPRVVIGDDAGLLLDLLLVNGRTAIVVYDPTAEGDRDQMIASLSRIEDLLTRIAAK